MPAASASEGDLEAARELVVSHLRVVVAISRGYLGYGLPQADLIQEGNIGLMKAVKRFDPERGVRLVSFAVHWIRAEMHEFILRNWRIVKIATTKAQRKLFFNLRSLKQSLNSLGAEEVKAMAKQLGVKPDEVVEMETRLTGKDIALEPAGDDEEEAFSPICLSGGGRRRARPPPRARGNRAPARARAETGAGEPRRAQPPHHRSALARREGCRRRCTISPPSSAFPPSASARSKHKALAKMKGVIDRQAA